MAGRIPEDRILRFAGNSLFIHHGACSFLEVELTGSHTDFPLEKLADILAENKSGSLTGMMFNAVKTAYRLHKKVAQTPEEPLIVKIRLSLSPEISVFVGRPKVC